MYSSNVSLIIKEKCNSYVNGYAIFDNKLDYYYYLCDVYKPTLMSMATQSIL
jgi:hypothetical protein